MVKVENRKEERRRFKTKYQAGDARRSLSDEISALLWRVGPILLLHRRLPHTFWHIPVHSDHKKALSQVGTRSLDTFNSNRL